MRLVWMTAAMVALAGCTTAAQPFELHTHCGLDRSLIEFDGSYWEPVGPGPLSDGAGNPPDGFDNPSDWGTIRRTGLATAVYESSRGVRVDLERLPARPDIVPCR